MEHKSRRYSHKREAIRDILTDTTSHPSAEWIYAKLKPVIPALSLATVYRNLGEMKQLGEIQSVAFVDGKERFDANVSRHPHFVCRTCGKIDDLHINLHDENLDEIVGAKYGGAVESHSIVFHGVCAECK